MVKILERADPALVRVLFDAVTGIERVRLTLEPLRSRGDLSAPNAAEVLGRLTAGGGRETRPDRLLRERRSRDFATSPPGTVPAPMLRLVHDCLLEAERLDVEEPYAPLVRGQMFLALGLAFARLGFPAQAERILDSSSREIDRIPVVLWQREHAQLLQSARQREFSIFDRDRYRQITWLNQRINEHMRFSGGEGGQAVIQMTREVIDHRDKYEGDGLLRSWQWGELRRALNKKGPLLRAFLLLGHAEGLADPGPYYLFRDYTEIAAAASLSPAEVKALIYRMEIHLRSAGDRTQGNDNAVVVPPDFPYLPAGALDAATLMLVDQVRRGKRGPVDSPYSQHLMITALLASGGRFVETERGLLSNLSEYQSVQVEESIARAFVQCGGTPFDASLSSLAATRSNSGQIHLGRYNPWMDRLIDIINARHRWPKKDGVVWLPLNRVVPFHTLRHPTESEDVSWVKEIWGRLQLRALALGWERGERPTGEALLKILSNQYDTLPTVSNASVRGDHLLLDGHHRVSLFWPGVAANRPAGEEILLPFHICRYLDPGSAVTEAVGEKLRDLDFSWRDVLAFHPPAADLAAAAGATTPLSVFYSGPTG